MNDKFKVAGFFSGVGGIELGFIQSGFDVIYSNEFDKNAAITFKENFNTVLEIEDIKKVKSSAVPNIDVIVGGFPCQAFSIAGYRRGFEDDRGELFFQLARIIRDKKPRAIFIENVKNLLTHDKGNTIKVIKETLESYGYKLIISVLNSSEYGNIPQNRERIYIVGFLNDDDFNNYVEITPIILEKTIFDIVNKDEVVDDKFYYKEDSVYFDELNNNINNPNTLYQWRRKYVRENKSNLCPTLTANMGTGGHNVPIFRANNGIRKLTPMECFKLQGYPEDFKLPNIAQSHLYKQAGNSVVVPVIKRIAEQIRLALEKTDQGIKEYNRKEQLSFA